MMKKHALIALLLSLALSVQAQRYTTLTSDVKYRICRVGSGNKKVTERCYAHLLLSAKTQRGQDVFSESCWLAIGEVSTKETLAGCLTMLSQGDSAELVMPARMFFSGMLSYPRAKGVPPKEPLSVHVRVLQVVEADIILDDGYDKFCADYTAYEGSVIKSYRRRHANFKPQGELWKRQLRAGNGKKTSKYGDAMMVAYEGRFLNGEQLDAGATVGEPFRYVRGQQWQVLQGMAAALASMSEGEKATFIMPSKVAFGAKGLADIVPPFTPVVYEVEVVRVIAKK